MENQNHFVSLDSSDETVNLNKIMLSTSGTISGFVVLLLALNLMQKHPSRNDSDCLHQVRM